MELFFLALLILLMAAALGSGFPVAFALPGSAIVTVALAAVAGWLFAGDVSAYFAHGGPSEWLTAGVTNFRGVYWEVERDTLIAIPLFVFMGIMLQRSRIAEDLLVTMAQLFGPVRGGLGISVVFVGGLLAATTGIVGATVVAMGLISLPAMLRNKYSHPLATGTIAASGTLGQIIPPSIVLIILADQLASATDQASASRKALYKLTTGELTLPSEFDVSSTSAGEMFLGAFVPGIILVGVYMLFIAVLALLRPHVAPAVPYDGKYDLRFAGRVALVLVPPLALIFIVLGSIIMGVATVNQAGAIGAIGALIMAGYRLCEGRRDAYWPVAIALISVVAIIVITRIHPINIKNIATTADQYWLLAAVLAVATFLFALVWSAWRAFTIDNTLRGVMIETAKTTSLVFIILLGAAMLTACFRAFGGEDLVREFLTALPGGFWSQFFIVMAVIFVLGFFLDFIEIAVVVVPIVAPILLTDPGANVTAVWLGVMIGINIQTSFLTPPFGFALFYLRGVAPPSVTTLSMYRGVVAFICMQLLVLGIVAVSPRLVNYLPQRLSLTSETAPPPVNPKLQYCVEQYVFDAYRRRGDEIHAAIARVQKLNLESLPEDMRKELTASFGKAEKTFDLLREVNTADAAVAARMTSYRPQHARVRESQMEIHRLEQRRKDAEADLRRVAGDDAEAQRRKQALESEIVRLQAQIKARQASIPANWEQAHKEFAQLLRQEKKARLTYRRNVDTAYQPVREAILILDSTDELAGLQDNLEGLRQVIAGRPPAEAAEKVGQVLALLGTVEGAGKIRSELSKVRRALRGPSLDPTAAAEALDETLRRTAAEIEWRRQAAAEVLPALRAYEQAIRDSIGLRQQPRLPKELAVEISGCMAHHRDISLHF